VLGHYHLWVGGVEHSDISVKNLMYDKVNGDSGILNDYDLAILEGRSDRPSGTDRTGTIPFMALDLLTDHAWEGNITRHYRHDCESFAWVLFWICCRYHDGKEIRNAPLGEFITDDYKQCFKEKYTLNSRLENIRPTTSYQVFWRASVEFVTQFLDARNDREREARQSNCSLKKLREPTVDEVLKNCRKALEGKGVSIFAELWPVKGDEEQGPGSTD
jgi:hypothetical protein